VEVDFSFQENLFHTAAQGGLFKARHEPGVS
jgi:hypothetical protein